MQGIAALPTGMAPEGAPAEQPAMGSLSAQEAATLGRLLTKVSEDEIEQLRELSEDLKEFTGPELKDFLGGIDYIMSNADNYKQAVSNLIQRGIVEPGDLPAQYIPTFYSILRNMVETALAESAASPKQFAKGGLVSMAEKVRKAGRHGDTMLAHITPQEAKALKAMGGAGTINPKTGLPEYKSFFSKVGSFLKKAAPVILPVALNFVAPGIGGAVGTALGIGAAGGAAVVGAVGAGVGGLIAGQKPAQALMSAALGGLGSYAMASMLPGGISGLLSGGATPAPGSSGIIGPGSGLEGVPEAYTNAGAVQGPAGSFRPDIPLPTARPADFGATLATGGTQAGQTLAQAPQPSGGLGDLFSGGITGALKNPWVAAGLAGTAGLMLGGSGKQQEADVQPTLVQGPSGTQLLQQQPGTYGFNVANFMPQTPSVQRVQTQSPAFAGGYQGQLPPNYATRYVKDGGHISGPGTGTSDDVPAMLSDGEFVLTAKAVRGAGNGDRMQGAKKLYKLMNQLEKRA